MDTATLSALGDEHSLEQFSHLLTKEEIKYFSRVDNRIFITALFSEVATITVTILLSEAYWHPLLYLLAIIILGSRYHALAVLMHDAAHYRAVSNRWWNDMLGEITALPLPISMLGYRNSHFAHHRELNSDNDPDWRRTRIPEFTFPKPKNEIILLLIQYALGMKIYAEMKAVNKEPILHDIPPRLKYTRYCVVAALFLAGIVFGFWKGLILYWVIPISTSFMFFLYIRSVAEHYTNLKYEHVLNHSRSVEAPAWELWLFAPHGTNYHLEHHLYPSVPYYRLHELHQHLMNKPVYAQSAHITKRYITGLFQESCCA